LLEHSARLRRGYRDEPDKHWGCLLFS
jgi:hypothetical protein